MLFLVQQSIFRLHMLHSCDTMLFKKESEKFSASGNTVKTVRLVRNEGYQMKEPENNAIQLFEDQKIRVAWDAEREEWYFSVVDVVGVLTDSPDHNTGRKYWNKLKQRLKGEGSELVTNCHQLKMRRGCRTGQSTQRRPQIGNESKNSYREILGNCRRWAAYISDFDRQMEKYLKGGEPN